MRRTWFLVAFRMLILVALAATSALLYDYTRPLPAFCEVGAGCETVRQSAYSHVAGIPQPVIGLLGLTALLVASFLKEPLRKFMMASLTALGALASLGFLAIQAFSLHTFCRLCVVVDVVLIIVAVLALGRMVIEHEAEEGRLGKGAWLVLALLAATAPIVFGYLQPAPPVPPGIARLWVPGKLTVVEMSDFECPFCRILHPRLSKILAAQGDRVHVVKMPVPLPSHKHARTATRAYFCGKAQGKGEQMADALFNAEDMSPDGCKAIAASLAPPLDMNAFQGCMDDPKTEALVTEGERRARAIGFRGLPTTWIGTQTLVGAQPEEKIRATIEQELQSKVTTRVRVPPWVLWLALAIVMVGAGVWSLGKRQGAAGQAG